MIAMTVIGILLMVVFGLIVVATIVGSVLFLSGRPHSTLRRVGGSIALVCGLMLAVVLTLGTVFVGFRSMSIQSVHARDLQRAAAEAEQLRKKYSTLPQPSPPQPMVRHEPESPLIPQADSGVVIVSPDIRRDPQSHPPAAVPAAPATSQESAPAGTLPNADAGLTRLPDGGTVAPPSAAQTDGKRPKWIESPETKTGDVTHSVLASKQYATLAEARNELAANARSLLARDFETIFHASSDDVRRLPLSEFQSLAVKQEYVETATTDFGNFTAPMHRVWWQVETSPDVRLKLRSLWKAQVQETRTLTVGGTLLALTVAFAGVSLFTRRKPAVMN